MPGAAASTAEKVVTNFSDNSLLPELFGKHDSNLALIEKRLGVTLSSRGNKMSIAGPSVSAGAARAVLQSLYNRLERGQTVETGDVEGAIRLAESSEPGGSGDDAAQQAVIRTRKRLITPRSAKQSEYRKSNNYLTRSLVELTTVGHNTSISRINEKLESFPAWNAASIDKRHGLLMALARDVWKSTPIGV